MTISSVLRKILYSFNTNSFAWKTKLQKGGGGGGQPPLDPPLTFTLKINNCLTLLIVQVWKLCIQKTFFRELKTKQSILIIHVQFSAALAICRYRHTFINTLTAFVLDIVANVLHQDLLSMKVSWTGSILPKWKCIASVSKLIPCLYSTIPPYFLSMVTVLELTGQYSFI